MPEVKVGLELDESSVSRLEDGIEKVGERLGDKIADVSAVAIKNADTGITELLKSWDKTITAGFAGTKKSLDGAISDSIAPLFQPFNFLDNVTGVNLLQLGIKFW